MEMTLNEYLAEVDRWKQTVSDRMAGLDPVHRTKADQDALDWLEGVLGRRLEVESPLPTKGRRTGTQPR